MAPNHSPATRRVHRRLGLILLVGLALRLVALPWTAGLGLRVADERHYHQLATSLADGRGFAFASGPTSLRPPLYPAFVAGVWMATGTRSLQAVRLAQIGLAIALAWIGFALARELFGETAGLATAAIVAFYPSLAVSNYLLLTEVLFALLLTAATWAMVRALRTLSLGAAALAGALVGLSALTRSVVYPLPVVLAAALLAGSGPRGQRLMAAVVLLAGATAVLAPWAIRNTRLQRVPVLVDTMGGMNLRMGNYEHTPLDHMWDAVSMKGEKSWIVGLPSSPPEGGHWTDGQKDRWARDQGVRFILDHPVLSAGRAAVKFGDFWGLDRDFIAGILQGLFAPPPVVGAALSATILLAYPIVLFAAIVGLGRLGADNWPAAWAPLGITLFVCALHSIVFGHPRYRLPLTPLIAVYAGAAIQAGALRHPVRLWARAALPAAIAAGFVAIWVAQLVWRDWDTMRHLLAVTGGA